MEETPEQRHNRLFDRAMRIRSNSFADQEELSDEERDEVLEYREEGRD